MMTVFLKLIVTGDQVMSSTSVFTCFPSIGNIEMHVLCRYNNILVRLNTAIFIETHQD